MISYHVDARKEIKGDELGSIGNRKTLRRIPSRGHHESTSIGGKHAIGRFAASMELDSTSD